MIPLMLSEEEAEVLRETLQSQLTDLDIEIRHTDYAEFKKKLKLRREIIARLAERMPVELHLAA